jgi:CheY-like chemotaxis protein/HPt (histidine-containing phosphotransfer) domain-containing protein
VVEDDEISQLVIAAMLEALGYQVDIAADGMAALERAAQRPYQVILMDCHMPRMDGLTATRELRRREHTADTPILALTADVLREDLDRCLAAGMTDSLPKPVRREALEQVLARWASPTDTAGHSPRDTSDRTIPTGEVLFPATATERLDEILGTRSDREVALAVRMINGFEAKAHRLIHEIRKAALAEDAEATAFHAHALKGAAATLGAGTLARRCQELEQLAREGFPGRVAPRTAALSVAVEDFHAELLRECAGYPELAAAVGGSGG